MSASPESFNQALLKRGCTRREIELCIIRRKLWRGWGLWAAKWVDCPRRTNDVGGSAGWVVPVARTFTLTTLARRWQQHEPNVGRGQFWWGEVLLDPSTNRDTNQTTAFLGFQRFSRGRNYFTTPCKYEADETYLRGRISTSIWVSTNWSGPGPQEEAATGGIPGEDGWKYRAAWSCDTESGGMAGAHRTSAGSRSSAGSTRSSSFRDS